MQNFFSIYITFGIAVFRSQYIKIIRLFLPGYLPYHPAGDSRSHHIRGNIPGDDTPCPDDGIVPDRNTTVDMYPCPDPDIVSNLHRSGKTRPCCSFFCIKRMSCRIDTHPRPKQYMVTNLYSCLLYTSPSPRD